MKRGVNLQFKNPGQSVYPGYFLFAAIGDEYAIGKMGKIISSGLTIAVYPFQQKTIFQTNKVFFMLYLTG